MLRTYSIRDSRVVEAPDGPISVYIAPDEAERRFLVESLRVDEHTLASALDPDELARLSSSPSTSRSSSNGRATTRARTA